MKALWFALLSLWTATAHAEKVAQPVLTIEHAVVSGVKKPTTKIDVYAGGHWLFVETDADGKQTRTANGDLSKDDIAKLVKALDAAPWTITHPRMHCNAMAQTYTVFTAGNHTFTEKTCGNDILDDKTKGVLDEADKQLTAAAAKK